MKNPRADSHAYIPPSIAKAMSASLPAHLQKYVGDNRPAYVPPQIQKQLNQQLQRMPTHLKQYSGAFMQQNVTQPNFNRPSVAWVNRTATDLPSRPPTPNHLRLEHSMPVGEQQTVKINAMGTEQTPSQQPASGYPTEDFTFLLNQETAPKSSPLGLLNNGNPMIKKLIVVAGGAVALIIIIVILASVFLGGKTNSQALITLAQQQNELIRVANEATSTAVNQPTKNLAINTELSLTSDQQQILAYLSQHHKKVSGKQLGLAKNSSTDQQLTQAQAASNFDTVYLQLTQNALNSYLQSLQQAYKTSVDNLERQMLLNEKSNATTLLNEANTATQALQG